MLSLPRQSYIIIRKKMEKLREILGYVSGGLLFVLLIPAVMWFASGRPMIAHVSVFRGSVAVLMMLGRQHSFGLPHPCRKPPKSSPQAAWPAPSSPTAKRPSPSTHTSSSKASSRLNNLKLPSPYPFHRV